MIVSRNLKGKYQDSSVIVAQLSSSYRSNADYSSKICSSSFLRAREVREDYSNEADGD